jgi:DNA-binding CsgD family transcriptional regulator
VALVAAGATNAEIARRLLIGLPTVEGVLRRLFDRYSVPNRTALARLADDEGWLPGPSVSPHRHDGSSR